MALFKYEPSNVYLISIIAMALR